MQEGVGIIENQHDLKKFGAVVDESSQNLKQALLTGVSTTKAAGDVVAEIAEAQGQMGMFRQLPNDGMITAVT